MIEYKNISLFNTPKYAIIIHAANAQGVWGSGIAAEFNKLYPYSYNEYKKFCDTKKVITGTAGFSNDLGSLCNEKHTVGWLITSENYGSKVDSKQAVLANTALAIKDLCDKLIDNKKSNITIYSNKFNSGLFKVPWEESEEVLKTVLKHYPSINWIICSP